MNGRWGMILLTLLCLGSCQRWKSVDEEQPTLLQLGDKVLYLDEVLAVMPNGLSGEDSSQFVESYKKKWATNILLYEKALSNVGSSPEIEEMTQNYRKMLIINKYQQQLIAQLMQDLPEDSVEAFYQVEKDHFPLEEAMIKGVFIQVANSTPKQAELSRALNHLDEEGWEQVNKYCTKYAVYYEIVDTWTPYSRIAKLLPQALDANDPALTRGTLIQQTEKHCFYLHITGFCPAGSPKPYELAKPELMEILNNQQQLRFIQNFKEELYQDAVEGHLLHFFRNL